MTRFSFAWRIASIEQNMPVYETRALALVHKSDNLLRHNVAGLYYNLIKPLPSYINFVWVFWQSAMTTGTWWNKEIKVHITKPWHVNC